MTTSTLQTLRRTSAPDAERWLEALPTPVIGVDAGGGIRFANAAAAELFTGLGRGLLGRRLEDVFGVSTPLLALVRRAQDGVSDVAEAEVTLGGAGVVGGRTRAAAAAVGEEGYVALVLTRPEKARVAPMLASPHAAVRTLAHEVRNPLAGIRAAAQLIGRGQDEELAALASLICAEVDRIHRLTERIDPLGGLPDSRSDTFNIHEALERVRRLIASSAPDVVVRERYDPSLPDVRGDLDQLIQAFLNIAKNAAEAVAGQEDGEIVIATAYRPGVRVRSPGGASPRSQLEVQIIDNGPGVHADVAERLFDAFATTKAGGMGLGLTVAADIVGRHQGRIEVETAPGRTEFRILLPIETEPSP